MKDKTLYSYEGGGAKVWTYSGRMLDVLNPDPEDILIEDIAHALSNQCRFGGHTKRFYSVGQHSIHVSQLVGKDHKLAALLHDASEAYLIDIPRPVKLKLQNYKEIEDKLMQVIASKFGFQYPLSKVVKRADEIMLQQEWDALCLGKPKAFPVPRETWHIRSWFLTNYNLYAGKSVDDEAGDRAAA